MPPSPRPRSFSSRLHGSPVVASLGGEGDAELGIIRVACLNGYGRQLEDGDDDDCDRQHDLGGVVAKIDIKSEWIEIPESI